MGEMTFDEKVKLARSLKNARNKKRGLEKQLREVNAEIEASAATLRTMGLTEVLVHKVTPAAWKRMSNANIGSYADILALNAFHMPEGIGKGITAQIEAAMQEKGLRIPTDRDGRG